MADIQRHVTAHVLHAFLKFDCKMIILQIIKLYTSMINFSESTSLRLPQKRFNLANLNFPSIGYSFSETLRTFQ